MSIFEGGPFDGQMVDSQLATIQVCALVGDWMSVAEYRATDETRAVYAWHREVDRWSVSQVADYFRRQAEPDGNLLS